MRTLGWYTAGLLIAGSLAAQEPVVVARGAWVRLPLISKSQTAMYLVLENHGAERRAVVGGFSDDAQQVELHEMRMDHAGMRMSPVASVRIPAKGKASFDPGGYHVMLFGLKKRLSVGDMVTVTLKLDDGSTIPVTASVRK